MNSIIKSELKWDTSQVIWNCSREDQSLADKPQETDEIKIETSFFFERGSQPKKGQLTHQINRIREDWNLCQG